MEVRHRLGFVSKELHEVSPGSPGVQTMGGGMERELGSGALSVEQDKWVEAGVEMETRGRKNPNPLLTRAGLGHTFSLLAYPLSLLSA